MDFKELLVFVHVLAAIVWVGGSFGFEIIAHRAIKRGGDAGMKAVAQDADALGIVFGVSAALVLGLGIWAVAVHDDVAFSDTWVWLSLIITAVLFLMGPLFFMPQGKRLIADSEAKGGTHPDVVTRAKRVLAVAHVDTAAALVVVYLMVMKPGG